jgi:predicted PurR-regulated permease PerM
MLNGQPSRLLLWGAVAAVGLWLLYYFWEIVVVVAAGFILMAALQPYVAWLMRHGMPRVAAVLLLLLAFLLVFAGILALIVPPLIDEAQHVKDELPAYGADLDHQMDRLGIDTDFEERASEVDWDEVISGRKAIDYGQRALFILLSLMSVVVITAYLLIDAPRLASFIYQFVPPGHEPAVQRFIERLRLVVGGYIRGQIITSAAIATYTTAVMFALRLPNALAFGVLAAFADIIPLIGSTLAVAPAVLVALDESPTRAAIALVALIAYQQFEDRVLAPRIYGHTLNLPPIIVLVAVLVGGKVFGITGVLIALPAAAAGRVVLDQVLERRARVVIAEGPPGDVLAPDSGTDK